MRYLLRRQVIASRFLALRAQPPDPMKITDYELAWAHAMG